MLPFWESFRHRLHCTHRVYIPLKLGIFISVCFQKISLLFFFLSGKYHQSFITKLLHYAVFFSIFWPTSLKKWANKWTYFGIVNSSKLYRIVQTHSKSKLIWWSNIPVYLRIPYLNMAQSKQNDDTWIEYPLFKLNDAELSENVCKSLSKVCWRRIIQTCGLTTKLFHYSTIWLNPSERWW